VRLHGDSRALTWNVAEVRQGVAPASSAGEGSKPVTEEPASEHRGGLSARVEIVDRVTPRPGEPSRSADAIHSP
jgi:hypothetical protein